MGANGTTAEFSKIMEKTLHTYNVPRSTGEPELIPLLLRIAPIRRAKGERGRGSR